MRAADVVPGMEVQLGGDGTLWTDEPRRAIVVAFEKRRRQDTVHQVRLRYLRPDGTVDPDPVGSEWWRPSELVPWADWYPGWSQRESRRAHRRSIISRLQDALVTAELHDLVSVQAGQAITGTVHMVIGDLVDAEVVADRLRRLAGH